MFLIQLSSVAQHITPKPSGLGQQFISVSVDQESGVAQLSHLPQGVYQDRNQNANSWCATSCEGSPIGGSAFSVVFDRIQFLIGCWTKGLNSSLVITQKLGTPFLIMWVSQQGKSQHGMVPGLILANRREERKVERRGSRDPERGGERKGEGEKEREGHSLYNLISAVTSCHFFRILFGRSNSLRPAHIQRERDCTST